MADTGRRRKKGKPGKGGSKGQGKGEQGKKGGGRDSQQNLIAALNHGMRRKLLRRLNGSSEPRSPVRLSKQLGADLGSVSYHMDVLSKCGAVALVDEEQVRGAMKHFFVSKVADNATVLAMLKETEDEDKDSEPPKN